MRQRRVVSGTFLNRVVVHGYSDQPLLRPVPGMVAPLSPLLRSVAEWLSAVLASRHSVLNVFLQT